MLYLLQIAGVNIYSTVEDTRQLSVQRGSSLLLRQAIKDVSTLFSEGESISTGASAGLFQFDATKDNDAAERKENVVATLNNNKNYKYLTFVVDVVKITNGDFQSAKEQIIALNRFRQFQQPTLVFPPENTNTETQPCAWDNLRPAENKKEKDETISLSARVRHHYGHKQKQAFIAQEIGSTPEKYNYTNNLQEITAVDKYQSHQKGLEDKLAVIYFDGNGFGNIQNGCKDSVKLKAFDQKIQQKRKEWLSNLLEMIKNDKNHDFKIIVNRKVKNNEETPKEIIRLEILLWGGDEIMVAVPAWRGMQVLQHFYQFHKDWTYEGQHLTHAGGLVFCHVKTPIQRIQKLAREIADHIKDECLGKATGKIDKYSLSANLYDYTVLESIDYPTQSWSQFLKKKYAIDASGWEPQKPLYDAYENKYAQEFMELTERLPRRQLYQLAHDVITQKNNFDFEKCRLNNVIDNATDIKETVTEIFPEMKSNLHWLHLIELWDYFSPQTKTPTSDTITYEEKQS